VYLESTVVVNKAQLAEPIHKKANARAGGTNHFSEHFLANFRNYAFGLSFLAKLSKQQEYSCQPFFAGIKELVNQVSLNPNISGKQIGDKEIGKCVLPLKHPQHLFPVDLEYCAVRYSSSGCEAEGLISRHAILPDKIPWVEQRNRGLFTRSGYDSELHPTLLDVEDCLTPVALCKDNPSFRHTEEGSAKPGLREESLCLEIRSGLRTHILAPNSNPGHLPNRAGRNAYKIILFLGHSPLIILSDSRPSPSRTAEVLKPTRCSQGSAARFCCG
jgi:hypothetical protein